jgi:hypothetical protein
MPFKDPEKRKEYKRKWYEKNKVSEVNSVKKRKAKIKKWFWEYKSNLSCSLCGESHPATIDFHHTGKKENQVAQMVHGGYSIIAIKLELEKCEVLCANCHRKLHCAKQKTLKPI